MEKETRKYAVTYRFTNGAGVTYVEEVDLDWREDWPEEGIHRFTTNEFENWIDSHAQAEYSPLQVMFILYDKKADLEYLIVERMA